jgi:hypothetical protein
MSRQMLKGVHRRSIGIGNDGQMMAPQGLETGGDGKPTIVFPSPDNVAWFDDFMGDTFAAEWVQGGDTGQNFQSVLAGTSVSGFTNGVFRMTSSASVTQTPQGGAQSLNSPPMWKANQGRLRFSARLKTGVLAGNTVFAGFTDTGGDEIGAFDTGGGILTPADNYVGFIWSGEGGATQQAYRCVAGKATVDQVGTPSTSITPTANVYDVLEIELPGNDGNTANFYINGKPYAQIPSAAVTATTALAGGIWRANTDAAADAIDIDWMNISAARDTGT